MNSVTNNKWYSAYNLGSDEEESAKFPVISFPPPLERTESNDSVKWKLTRSDDEESAKFPVISFPAQLEQTESNDNVKGKLTAIADKKSAKYPNISFTPAPLEQTESNDSVKWKLSSLVWPGLRLKSCSWYDKVSKTHFQWMHDIGGERVFIGNQDQSKIDTMFFSAETLMDKIREAGGRYCILTTTKGKKIHGFVFNKETSSRDFVTILQGFEGKNGNYYGFLNSGWKCELINKKIVLYPCQFDLYGQPMATALKKEIKILDDDLSFSTKNTVVIAPGLTTLYELYDEILGEVPAFLMKGVNVMLFNYRGHGESQGLPSKKTLDEDLDMILKYLEQEKGVLEGQLILKGNCLGGAIVSRAAVDRPAAKVILDQIFADTHSFIKTLTKKELNSMIPFKLGKMKSVAEKLVVPIGRKVFPRYNNSEELSKMKNDLCIIVNNDDNIIPKKDSCPLQYDEVSKNLNSLPQGEDQIVEILFIEGILHAEGWYRQENKKLLDGSVTKTIGLSQVHGFLDKIGFAQDITKPTTDT